MPWKLIGIIVCVVIVLVLVGFNLDHKTDISLLFYEFEAVSTFIALFIAFILGVFVAIPLTLLASRKRRQASLQEAEEEKKRKEKKQQKKKSKKPEEPTPEESPVSSE